MDNIEPKFNIDLSDRSLLCLAFRDGTPYVVSGGADHGLKVFKLEKIKKKKKKNYKLLYILYNNLK